MHNRVNVSAYVLDWIWSILNILHIYNLWVQTRTCLYYRLRKERSTRETRPLRTVTDNRVYIVMIQSVQHASFILTARYSLLWKVLVILNCTYHISDYLYLKHLVNIVSFWRICFKRHIFFRCIFDPLLFLLVGAGVAPLYPGGIPRSVFWP